MIDNSAAIEEFTQRRQARIKRENDEQAYMQECKRAGIIPGTHKTIHENHRGIDLTAINPADLVAVDVVPNEYRAYYLESGR